MRRPLLTVAIAATSVLLAGCSPSSPEAIEAAGLTQETADDPVIPTGPGGAIAVDAGDLFFVNLTGAAADGPVEVTINNIGDAEHNIRIDQAAGDDVKVTALGGETTTGTLLLFGQPGGTEYTYYCDIPGHRSAGMEGTLFVYADVEEAADEPLGTVTDGMG